MCRAGSRAEPEAEAKFLAPGSSLLKSGAKSFAPASRSARIYPLLPNVWERDYHMRVVRQIDGIIFPVGMTCLPLSTCCVDMFVVRFSHQSTLTVLPGNFIY